MAIVLCRNSTNIDFIFQVFSSWGTQLVSVGEDSVANRLRANCHLAGLQWFLLPVFSLYFLIAYTAQIEDALTLTPSCPSVSAPSLYSVERSTFTCSYSPFGRQAILFFSPHTVTMAILFFFA